VIRTPHFAPRRAQCPDSVASQPCYGQRYTPGVTIAVPILITIIGLAILFGRKAPGMTIAVIFTFVGVWLGRTWVGDEIVTGFASLARLFG
jgi:hypothetical protein